MRAVVAVPVALAAALAAAVVLAGCTKPGEERPAGAPASTAPAADAAKPAEPPPIPPRVSGPVGDVLDAYDALQVHLAHDDAAGAQASAGKIASAARDAAAAATGATKAPLTDLAAAADKLGRAGDITAARDAFGEVSKAFVSLLVADPSLQTGRFLFLCPMAKGYQKWVQSTEKLENPFFGKAMSDCGDRLKDWSV